MRTKLEQFDQLTVGEKAKLVLNDGIYISQVKYHQLEISLYRIDDQFFEMWFDTFNQQLIDIQSMDDRVINPYLKHLENISLN